ncbi:MAG: Gfo/Idh/MocA family oxidoreductase [Candidatus Latescibacterota bacterium]|jgi:myo-inositol 2-dehydrogenase/D-chiro-inositol 1-dehydrogenase
MLRIAFVGCGGIARHHASRLVQLKNARITACADVDPAAAAAFARDFGAAQHDTDFRRVVRRDDVDAVFVCTPTYLHAPPVIAAARAGKAVFCEKPISLKPAEAERMAEACDRAGVPLTIGFVRRFDAQWGKLRQLVQAGAVGRPVIWRFAAGGKPGNPWFRDVNKGGGPLVDGAVHNYDFALQTFGPVESVQASSLRFDQTSVGADTASVILSFASGDQHTLIWTWGAAQGAAVASLNDVIGPKGSLQFGMTAAEAPAGFDPKQKGAFTLRGGQGRDKVHTYPLRDMFVEQLRHVVTSLAQGKQPLVTARDGIEALRIAAAVLKSGETRRTVKL